MGETGTTNQRRSPARNVTHLFDWMGGQERSDTSIPATPPEHCPKCASILPKSTQSWQLRVCPACQLHLPIPVSDRISMLVDDGTFREQWEMLSSDDPLSFRDSRSYRERLAHQRTINRRADALITGQAQLGGMPITLAVLDFTFMGGSMGIVVGEKLAAAAEEAERTRKPLITVVASGGARMQEGMFALWQMARTAAAIKRLRAAGVPYISILSNPTTGGVFASFASLGDIILAEPGALIGFAGPRVAEAVMGKPLPEGSHTAENLLDHGHIDAVVPRSAHRKTLIDIISAWQDARTSHDDPVRSQAQWRSEEGTTIPDAWDLTTEVRSPARPSARAYIDRVVSNFQPLAGDRLSGDDPSVIGGIGRITDMPAMVIGLDRGHDSQPDIAPLRPYPAGFRKSHRLLSLAAIWRLPVVMLVDTPGAWPGIESEQGGLAGAIAQNLALLSDLPTPTISVVIGEGGSGGALALAVADRTLIQERAIFSVIAPEGAAAILHRDTERAPELARSLRITARDLESFGMVDGIIMEPSGGAGSDPDLAAEFVERAISMELDELRRYDVRDLVKRRYSRVRHLGEEHIVSPSRAARVGRWLRGRIRSESNGMTAIPQFSSGTD